jgi:hypothetical protein
MSQTMTEAELRAWAEAHSKGDMVMPQAAAVLALFEELDRLRKTLDDK